MRADSRWDDLLCCPACLGVLALAPGATAPDGHIMTGTLNCTVCATVYSIQRGVPRLAIQAMAGNVASKAWIDNVEAPLQRMDYAVMGVAVPGGQHRVRLTFQPGSLRLGAGVSGVGALAAIACLLAPLRRRRTAGVPGEAPRS